MVYLEGNFEFSLTTFNQSKILTEIQLQQVKNFIDWGSLVSGRKWASSPVKIGFWLNGDNPRFTTQYSIHPGYCLDILFCSFSFYPGGMYVLHIVPSKGLYTFVKIAEIPTI